MNYYIYLLLFGAIPAGCKLGLPCRKVSRRRRKMNELVGRTLRLEGFDQWAALAEKGLLNGHIDWDILYECTCDAMVHYGDGK